MKKIKVPEGMLEAASRVFVSSNRPAVDNLQDQIEAALLWLTEHPIVPTDEQIADMMGFDDESPFITTVRTGIRKWQRRMFDDPDPEVPEEIKDLMARWGGKFDDAILEAYRRGQHSQKP